MNSTNKTNSENIEEIKAEQTENKTARKNHREHNDRRVNKEKQIAMRVSAISIVVNVVLSVFKLFAGIFAHSGAMISDAVHSASDVFSTIVVIIGVNISSKEKDAEHPYGHERMESIAAIILAAVLFATGAGIGYDGLLKIIARNYDQLTVPGALALIAAVFSIAVKEWMYWFTRAAAKKINSDALMADAWHHRSDALSSIGSLVGIGGAMLGFPVLDSLASVGICIFILKAAIDIFRDAISKVVDKSCDKETIDAISEIALMQDNVIQLDLINTRMFGPKIYVDIEIGADENLRLKDSHEIAEHVHDEIERAFPNVKHCMVHVNPVSGITGDEPIESDELKEAFKDLQQDEETQKED